jgi:hypothetical protein
MDLENDILTDELEGAVAQYDETLLFIGFNLGDGQIQFTVYPGYRFPADDRVHGHIGIFDVPLGTRWAEILARVDAVSEEANRNYRRCVAMRQGRGRSGGRQSASLNDHGPDHIAEQFRESWAASRLRLAHEGEVQRRDVTFSGPPDAPFLATWQGRPYTVRVYPTGSALVLPDDRRAELRRLESRN